MLGSSPWSSQRQRALGRAINEAKVMDVLHRAAASRAAISRATGLSKPTVSAVIRDLEEAGLVRLGGRLAGRVGRSSTLYEVNSSAAFGLGFDVGGTSVRAALTDLYGASLAEATEPTRRERPEELIGQLVDLFARLVATAGIDRRSVRAAGISVPGVIHPESDEITASYNVPALARMHPQHAFAEALGVPVVIANDVDLAAAGEQWRGSAAGIRDFVAVSVGTGIGVGIVLDGIIQLGARGAAGEIGLLPLRPGPIDKEHMTGGPLEDAVSGPAALARLRAALADGRATTMPSDATLPEMFQAALAGDPLACDLVEQEAQLLAFGIAAMVAVVDPGLVVLGGGVGANEALLDPVRRHVATMVVDPPQIVTTSLGGKASLYGAIAVALNAVREQLLVDVRRVRGTRGLLATESRPARWQPPRHSSLSKSRAEAGERQDQVEEVSR